MVEAAAGKALGLVEVNAAAVLIAP